MDKETLSNYGWIVICVLVLAVMIALAGPFGNFVADAVKSTAQGLFDVNQGALDAADIAIDNQEFNVPNGNGGAGENGGQTPVVPETPAVTLVTFTINDLTNKVYALQYQAEEGMTWSQWLASEYNKDAYVFESTSIYLDSGNNTQTLLTSGGHYDEIAITANSTYQIINPKSTNVEIPVNLITFTIDGIEYQAIDGMTWGEWVESEYNTGGFWVTSTLICGQYGTIFYLHSATNVYSSETIVSGDYEIDT